MATLSPTFQNHTYQSHPVLAADNAEQPGIESPPSLSRKFIEFMLYLQAFNSAFAQHTGIGNIPYACGGIIMATGFICWVTMKFQGERMPMSFWFAFVIVLCAHVSQMIVRGAIPIIGEGLNVMTLWICHLIVFSYLVRNEATQKRILVVFTVLIAVSVVAGGATARTSGRLEMANVATAFNNSNDLAHMSGLFAISMLFWSLRSSKTFRPVIWFLAGVLVIIMIKTVSRGGIASFGCGLTVLMIAILLGRGVRVSGIILFVVILLASSQLLYLVTTQLDFLQKRFSETGKSGRLAVYRTETLHDLWNTKLFGEGLGAQTTTARISAHNSFIYTHMSYGGITAWPYLIWILILSIRVSRMILAKDFPLDVRFHILAIFGMCLAVMLLTNMGYIFFSSLYTFAMIDKYTSIYSRHNLRERRWAQYYSGVGQQDYTGTPQVSY